VIQKLAGLVRPSYVGALNGWILFLSFVIAVLACVLAARWTSSRLLWRLRNRLIVTYVFIGVIPLLLLLAIAGLAFVLFAGQFATYIVSSRLDAEIKSLHASNLMRGRQVAAELSSGRSIETVRSTFQVESGTQTWIWLDSKFLFGIPSELLPPVSPPGPPVLDKDQALIARDGPNLFIRSVMHVPTKSGRLALVSSKPVDRRTLLGISESLGQLTLEQSFETSSEKESECDIGNGATFRPMLTVGAVPPLRRAFDKTVTFSTCVKVLNWRNGKTSNTAAIDVQTTLFALGTHLFAAPGAFATSIEVGLGLAAAVLGAMVLAALFIGTRLTRSITSVVAELYAGTTHINRGNFSHRIPVRSKDQLAALAGSFNLMTESIEKLILEQKEKQRLQNEITIAQEVQAQLFPRHIAQLPSLEVHGFCRPARSVSGDYYDFLPLGQGKLMLAVGDVSGKGISAALLMATIHSAVRAHSMEGIPALRQIQVVAGPTLVERYDSILPGAEVSPGTLLSLLNHQLVHTTPMEKYATMFLAVYDSHERTLNFSNAGHLPPLLLSGNGDLRRLEDGGTVVGLFDDLSFDEGSVQLRTGDIFLAYSDGVTEPENDFGEFGEQRLIELVKENRDLPLERISELVTAAVDDWIGGAEQPDDVTLVLARAR
jgi:sigma-B regulation protein RsbU (phosphoserine phosphatase)